MARMTRRAFGALGLGATAAAWGGRGAFAQGAGCNFMTFTFAEDPNRPFIEKLLADFKASSGIAVDPIGTAWGDTLKNILLRQRSKTLPDTAQLQDRWVPAMATLPEIVELTPVLGAATLESIDPGARSLGKVDGKQVGIPLISGSVGFVANKEVMAKAGIDKVPVTLDEFRAALVQVRDKVPNSVPFAMATKNPGAVPLDVLLIFWAHNARMIDESGKVLVNSPEGRAAMAFMAGLMKDRLIAPEFDRPDSRRLFGQGGSAFYIDAPAARTFARSFSGKGEAADAFVLPMKTPVLKAGDTPKSVEWGHTVVMFKNASAIGPDTPAAKWMKFLLSDGVQTTLPLQLGGLPVTTAGRAAPAVQSDVFLKAWAGTVVQAMKHEIGIWSNGPELSTILTEEVQAAILGQKTPDAATASMQTRMEASMAKRG
jgi:multiple sugar transport system substrate-binding protein